MTNNSLLQALLKYVPSALRAEAISTRFGSYVAFDGASIDKLDKKTVSKLQIALGDHIAFTTHFTWYDAQYSAVIIRIVAPGVARVRQETIGTIAIKGVSVESIKHQRHSDRDDVSQKLAVFCDPINENDTVPAQLVTLNIKYAKAHVAIPDCFYNLLRTIQPAVANKLDEIRQSITESVNKTIDVVFHATDGDLDYIETVCRKFGQTSAIDKDKAHVEYPFAPFFKKSPIVQQLHYDNAPWPSKADFPFFGQVIAPVDSYDTAEEQIVPLVMGEICDHYLECKHAYERESAAFAAYAIQLRYHGDHRFLLLVRSSAGGGTYQPQEGELCHVSLKDVRRAMPSDGANMNGVDACKWWRAERIPTPIAGAPAACSTFIVTLPSVPKSEAPDVGLRPFIDVEFPMLKWEKINLDSPDRDLVATKVKELLEDDSKRLTVSFRSIISDKTSEGAISAINDLHTPQFADKEFPVSDWSLETYRFLLDFCGGKIGNAFEKYPHMRNILDHPERVPSYLRKIWEKMDEKKKEAYRGLENLVQNIKWIVSVAGTGKTTFLHFVVHMALFGDQEKDHQIKVLYFVNRNSAVRGFASELSAKAEALGKGHTVVRLHGYESEVSDWSPSRILQHHWGEVFDEQDGCSTCLGVDGHFTVQHQLAQMTVDTNDASVRPQRLQLSRSGLHESAYRYYLAHQDQFSGLRDALKRLDNGEFQTEDEAQIKTTIRELVNELYAKYLKQFSGVIFATPHTGCLSSFVRNFEADICLIDDAAKIGDLAFLQIIRAHTPKFLLAVGDPAQLGPRVQSSSDEVVDHPFQEYFKKSTLERAVNIGNIADTPLTMNHRGYGGLPALPAKVLYHDYMQPAKAGTDAWSSVANAWHAWLLKLCPTLSRNYQRVLVELQGALCEKSGRSFENLEHVEHVADMVYDALKNRRLTGDNGRAAKILIIAMYRLQVYHHQDALDIMVHGGRLTPAERRQVMVCTVGSAQGLEADLVFVDFTRNVSPGSTADLRRLCVAMTRARYAEVILMSRGIFVEENLQREELEFGHNVRALAAIYEHVALAGGVVTRRCT